MKVRIKTWDEMLKMSGTEEEEYIVHKTNYKGKFIKNIGGTWTFTLYHEKHLPKDRIIEVDGKIQFNGYYWLSCIIEDWMIAERIKD